MPRVLETVLLTATALVAFAFNSILTRMALGRGLIGAAGFSAVRLATGAVALAVLVRLSSGSWRSLRPRGLAGPLALLAYVVPFSLAYLRLGAATGALVLFGTVQLSMIGWGLVHGERPSPRTWLGLLLATAGLAALTLPGASRPDLAGTLLMALAGLAWAAYSVQGKQAPDPLAANARGFLWSAPLALLLGAAACDGPVPDGRGLVLAGLSGAVTSGLGYAVWYRALRGLTTAQAAVVQLAVPVIAAVAAVALLGEPLAPRLVACGAAVLGGVALALTGRARPTP